MSRPLRMQRDTTSLVTIALMLTIAPTNSRGDEKKHSSGGSTSDSNALVVAKAAPPTSDRIWTLSTRHLTYNVRNANLENPSFATYRLDTRGGSRRVRLNDFYQELGKDRDLVVYVHGNRLDREDALDRGLSVYQLTRCYQRRGPVDWVIMTWPSDKEGMIISDARRKLLRINAQGMYLACLLRKRVELGTPTTLIGYSFGVRIISGALHAMAGGKLGGRTFPAEPITGIPYDVGFVAPATESNALSRRGVHYLATKNMDQMVLLYNRHDAVLKRYWLLNMVQGTLALGYTGYTGPRAFAPRADNTTLPIQSRECSYGLGIRHDEVTYYRTCRAGRDMAALINDIDVSE
jgi:hypothetical protein